MTGLERQLTSALETLSAQYEMERRQHAEQVEALQQQVEAYGCGSSGGPSRAKPCRGKSSGWTSK